MKLRNRTIRTIMLSLPVLAGSCQAGEMQFAVKAGGAMLRVDADRTRDGDGFSANGMAVGGTLGYRADSGLLVELGILGSFNVDSEHLTGAVHKSLGVGWQFDHETWRLTPKAGLLHSYLDSAEGRELIEDGRPSERFTDTVPFVEAAADRRIGERFAIGLFFRHIFEDFGDSQAWGLTFSWSL